MAYTTKHRKMRDVSKEVLGALEQVSDIVCATMGPGGRNILIHTSGGVISTKDGVTVCRYLNLNDPIHNMIAMMAIDAASKTVKEVGDGTTTSVCLFEAIYKSILQELENVDDCNKFKVAAGVDVAVENIKQELLKMAVPLKDEYGSIDLQKLTHVCTISANNDAVLGGMIAEAIAKVGELGQLEVRESRDGSTYVDYTDGYVFNTIPLQHFIPKGKESATYENPLFFIGDIKFSSYDDIQPIIDAWKKTANAKGEIRPLIMIVSDVEGSALSAAVVNNQNGNFPIAIVKAPGFLGHRYDMMHDISVLTNTRQVFSLTTGNTMQRFGYKLGSFKFLEFGSAKQFVLYANRAIIVPHAELHCKEIDPTDDTQTVDVVKDITKAVNALVEDLRVLLDRTEEEGHREQLKDRLSRLSSGIGTVYVGGNSDIEVSFKKMVIDDTIKAAFAALDGGVVIGGGNALLKAAAARVKIMDETIPARNFLTETDAGELAVYVACSSPFARILKNMFVDCVVESELNYIEHSDDNAIGYNLATKKAENLFLAGIIDPVNVTISALKNAASVAKQLFLTEHILQLEEKL